MPAASKPPEATQLAPDAPETPEPPKTLHEAIWRVQAELPKVAKSGTNPHFNSRFVTLDALMDAVLPVLNRNGLIWITMPVYRPEGAVLRYRLIFADDGESIEGEMLLLAAKDDPQGQGAAITYARRYALTAVLGITADEDDDGERAVTARQSSQQRQQDARNAARPMTPEELERMQEAVRVAGGDLAELTAQAGVQEGETPTIGQGRRIKELLAL